MRQSLLKYWVLYLLFVCLSTEIFSVLNIINRTSVILLYLPVLFFLLSKIPKIKLEISFPHPVLIFSFITILLPLLFIALYYPPNNWDSMTYHLPRIEHWIQSGNLNFYPTNNDRQLYLGPLSEYVIMHWRLLTDSDYFSNLVQYLSLVFSAITVSLIAEKLGGSSRSRILSALLVLTIPMGIMQATTTQNDYLVSSLLLGFIYFGLTKNRYFFAICTGLGLLAKSTFFIFALPFGLLFVLPWIKRSLPVLFFFVLIINFGHWSKNYLAYRSIFGPRATAGIYINQSFLPKYLVSNLIRNYSLNLGFPRPEYNLAVDSAVLYLHRFLNISPNDPSNTFLGRPYLTNFLISEDLIGNFLHLVLVFGVGIFVIGSNIKLKKYYLSGLAGWILFSVIFKWQPWGTRLQLPFFVAMCPVIGVTLGERLSKRYLFTALSIGLIVISWPFVAGNMIINWHGYLSLSGSHRQLGLTMFNSYQTRFERYFITYPGLYKPYLEINKILLANNVNRVGLDLDGDSWEYPLWVILKGMHLEYIRDNPNYKYQAVIFDDTSTIKLINRDRISSYYDFNDVKLLVLK